MLINRLEGRAYMAHEAACRFDHAETQESRLFDIQWALQQMEEASLLVDDLTGRITLLKSKLEDVYYGR